MDTQRLTTTLRTRLRHRMLLDHPFYQRWSRGEVGEQELRAYAEQYRHFEAMLPEHLQGVADGATHAALREQALRNLADEAGGTPTHLELFERFAAALDAEPQVAPSAAMTGLLDGYASALDGDAACGFAALLAYELQSPEVAASKAEGLRRHGILDGEALAFWDLHATLDGDHAQWAAQALVDCGADEDRVLDAAEAAAQAWWEFLDEREMLRA